MLDDGTIAASQKDNIKAVIKMYENGELPKRIGELIFVQDGKVCKGFPDVLKEQLVDRGMSYAECVLYDIFCLLCSKGMGMQLMQAPVNHPSHQNRLGLTSV